MKYSGWLVKTIMAVSLGVTVPAMALGAPSAANNTTTKKVATNQKSTKKATQKAPVKKASAPAKPKTTQAKPAKSSVKKPAPKASAKTSNKKKSNKGTDIESVSRESGKLKHGFAVSVPKNSISFSMPIYKGRITSGFGARVHPITRKLLLHEGVDFAAPIGTPIVAPAQGVVERVAFENGYGKTIRIKHANGYSTLYAHLNGFAKNIYAGKTVKRGQTIGYVGRTGRVTGPHLHFEVHHNDRPINPMRVLKHAKLGSSKKSTVKSTKTNKAKAKTNLAKTKVAAKPVTKSTSKPVAPKSKIVKETKKRS